MLVTMVLVITLLALNLAVGIFLCVWGVDFRRGLRHLGVGLQGMQFGERFPLRDRQDQ
jgi:hypothetical protein